MKVPACTNGSNCQWLKRGSYSFFHSKVGVQRPNRSQGGSQGGREGPVRRGNQESRAEGGRQNNGSWGGRQVNRISGGRQESRSPGGRQESSSWGSSQVSSAPGGSQDSRAIRGRRETRPRRQDIVQPDREQCRFDGRCERIPNCPYIHSMEDFPPLQAKNNLVVRRNPIQRRN